MSSPDPVISARGRLAAATRFGRPDDAERARQDMAAALAERAVREHLHVMRDEHRLHIAAVLVAGVLQ